MNPPSCMPELDIQQRRALESGAKTIIVTGAPGSGKTHLLARRLEFLVKSEGIPLSSILVFTFSAAGATRIRRMVELMIEESYDELNIYTYHSFASRILTEHAVMSATPPPTFVTPFREYLVAKELLQAEQPRFKSHLRKIASKDGLAREMTDLFGRLKQNLISPDEFEKMAQDISTRLRDVARMYSAHASYMEKKNWLGPGDAVAHAIDMLEGNPEFLEECRRRFRNILADEFQELDPAQLRLVGLLASDDTSMFLTGDEDQRIYRFRGSATDQFSEIAGARGEIEAFDLSASHRLPHEHLKASRNLIAHNHGAESEPSPVNLNGGLNVLRYSDPIEQAYGVARDIKRRITADSQTERPIGYSDFAVICRSASQSAYAIEEAFSYYAIPHILHNSTSFYKHWMVRSIAAFVRLLVDSSDDSSLLRVLGIPAFGADAVWLSKLVNDAAPTGESGLFAFLRKIVEDGETTGGTDHAAEQTLSALERFFEYFDDSRKRALGTDCPSATVHFLMADLFFDGILSNEDIAAGTRDARNLRLLYEVASDIEGVIAATRGRCALSDVAEHLEHAFAHFSSRAESDPAEEQAGGVGIMTVHQAKGMGFPFVYLIDMTEECFPHLVKGTALLNSRSLKRLEKTFEEHAKAGRPSSRTLQLVLDVDEQLKEERRLAYVALTRASRHLVICFTDQSNVSDPAQPSPFIEEFIGNSIEDLEIQDGLARMGRSSARSLLSAALNKRETESALRECVRGAGLDEESVARLSEFLEALGLDSGFICERSPFEGEPPRALDFSAHVYSASQLSTYLVCPRRFFFEKILRIAPERPEDFGLGQLIHNTLELFHRQVRHFGEIAETLWAHMDRAFRRVWIGEGGGKRAKEAFRDQYGAALQQATIERRAKRILARYLRTEMKQASDREVIACEESIDFDVRGYPFVARIDRIDSSPGGHHIIDHKTSASGSMRPGTIKKKFLNVDDKPDYRPEDFQLPLYLLASRSAGYDPVELAYYWLAQEDSKGMFKKASLGVGEGSPELLSAEEIEATEESIVEVVRRIAAGRFEPHPKSSYECSRCSFDIICSIGDDETDDA